MGGLCGTGRRKALDLQMEVTYATDGGGPMICMYYAGDPPDDSTGALLAGVHPKLRALPRSVDFEIYLWDVTLTGASDWRAGLNHFGISESCELPAIVLHAQSRSYRQPLRTLEGWGETQPERVLQAMRECWSAGMSDELWEVLTGALGPGAASGHLGK